MASVLARHRLKSFHCFKHSFDARNFMCAEQIRFAQRGENGEERLGATDFVAEKFKRMGQGMANWKSKCSQSERVQKNVHLMAHANGAVLQIAVVKTKTGIEK